MVWTGTYTILATKGLKMSSEDGCLLQMEELLGHFLLRCWTFHTYLGTVRVRLAQDIRKLKETCL